MGRRRGLRLAIGSTTLRVSAVVLVCTSLLTSCGAERQADPSDPCSLVSAAEASQILHTTPVTGRPYLRKLGGKKTWPDLARDGLIEDRGCSYGSPHLRVAVGVLTYSSARRARAFAADGLTIQPGYVRVSAHAAINAPILGIMMGTAIEDRRVLLLMATDGRHIDSAGWGHPDFDLKLYRQVFKRASQEF